VGSKPNHDAERRQILPIVTLDLDAGVFNWLHEIVLAKDRAASPGLRHIIPSYDELLKRAVAAFEAAAPAGDETPPARPVRRIKRREPEPAPEPPRRGRIKRRSG